MFPVHKDGTPTGQQPRLRHDPKCEHFDLGDGDVLGTPVLASADQMSGLKACKSCVEARAARQSRKGRDGPVGSVCPKCFQARSLTGICGNCD